MGALLPLALPAGALLVALALVTAKRWPTTLLAAALAAWAVGPFLRPAPAPPVASVPAPVAALPAPTLTDAPLASATTWTNVPPAVARWQSLIERHAATCGVDPLLVAAIVYQESGGDPEIVNRKPRPGKPEGSLATGLGQVMPWEASKWYKNAQGRAYFTDRPTIAQLQDPDTNLSWSMKILCANLTRSGLQGLDNYSGGEPAYRRIVGAHYLRFTGQSLTDWRAPAPVVGGRPVLAPLPPREPGKFAAAPLSPMPRIFKGFGVAVNYQAGGKHSGIDVAGPPEADGKQARLYAVGDATVTYVGPLYCDHTRQCRGSHAIVLDLGSHTYAIYSHNSEAWVKAGDRVKAGQAIGRQGNEGYSLGSHLHLEVHTGAPFSGDWEKPFRAGQFVDPAPYLP